MPRIVVDQYQLSSNYASTMTSAFQVFKLLFWLAPSIEEAIFGVSVRAFSQKVRKRSFAAHLANIRLT